MPLRENEQSIRWQQEKNRARPCRMQVKQGPRPLNERIRNQLGLFRLEVNLDPVDPPAELKHITQRRNGKQLRMPQ